MQKPNNNKHKNTFSSKKETNYSGKPKSASKPFQSKPKPKSNLPKNTDEIRLNKYISNSGVCSRREADIYIQSGNVKVNGEVVTEMGYKVKPGDVVNFHGSTLTPESKIYILLNKPKNFTTANDEDIDKSVYELVKNATTSNIQAIGRMDKNTTGLLLFTNYNDLIVKFNASNQKSIKIYHVSLDRNLKYEDLEKIASGISLDEHRLNIEEIEYIENEPKTEIGIKLRTANVKVVRAIFEKFDYNVLRVDRVSFAGLTKENLPRGNWRMLTSQEIINLKNN